MKQESAREPVPGNPKFRISRLSFTDIPHQSRLFTDYLRDPASLWEFYPDAVDSPLDIGSYAPKVLDSYAANRSDLCDALIEINSQVGAGEKSMENIELLRDADVVTVLTGQQAGLFTGP